MARYGRGLGREIYEAARQGIIRQPFTVSQCRRYVESKGWYPPETYMRVVLANSEVRRKHSETYRNYFIRVAEGLYRINPKL